MRPDMFEREQDKTAWWENLLGGLIIALMFFVLAFMAGALQQHYECVRGIDTSVCIPEDFQ